MIEHKWAFSLLFGFSFVFFRVGLNLVLATYLDFENQAINPVVMVYSGVMAALVCRLYLHVLKKKSK